MQKRKQAFYKNNSGQFNPVIAASLAVILITVALGSVILGNLRAATQQATVTQVNDLQLTGGASGAPVSLGNVQLVSGQVYFENITNATNTIVGAPNVTIDLIAGTANFSTTFQNQLFNTTYNFTDNVRTGAYNVTASAGTGMTSFASTGTVLGTVVVATLIIGLLGTVIVFLRR